ncbi:MAG: type IV secretory system conjugative DNA transfer family protein [Propionibacteriaceae bacterium]|jgi:type IV secretion system protein VirD4|nr:type IV secretory system conjugative DNA transfer family protein [Propionibacteriaceae bacterium]
MPQFEFGLPDVSPVVPLVFVLVCLAGLVALWMWSRSLGKTAPADGLDSWRLGSRRWAGLADVRELVGEPGPSTRLRLGWLDGGPRRRVLLRTRREASVLVCAPSRSGKTHRVIAPQIMEFPGPVLSTSVKADVFTLTLAARRRLGKVFLFDPTGQVSDEMAREQGVVRVRWSPQLGIKDWAGAQRAAATMCKASAGGFTGVTNGDFWATMAQTVAAPVLWAAALTRTPITTAARWVLDPATEAVVEDVLTRAQGLPGFRDADKGALTDWHAFMWAEDRNKNSMRLTAKPIMEAWGRAEIAGSVDVFTEVETRTILDLDEFLDGSNTLFLVAAEKDQDAFAPIFEAIVNAVVHLVEDRFQAAARPLDPPLLMSLDEAGNIAAIPDLDKFASTAAGLGIDLVTVWQDKAQIVKRYGAPAAATILGNHWAHIFLPGIKDPDTLETISAMVGQDEREAVQTSWGPDGRASRSVSRHLERVAPPDWIRTRPQNEAIVIAGELPPMRVTLQGWFDEMGLRELVDPETAQFFDDRFAPRKKSKRRRREGQ